MEIEPLDTFDAGEMPPELRERVRSCEKKVRFNNPFEAECPGVKVYHCRFCNGWHRATDQIFVQQRVLEKRLNRQEQQLLELAKAEKKKKWAELRKQKPSRYRRKYKP